MAFLPVDQVLHEVENLPNVFSTVTDCPGLLGGAPRQSGKNVEDELPEAVAVSISPSQME